MVLEALSIRGDHHPMIAVHPPAPGLGLPSPGAVIGDRRLHSLKDSPK